MSDSPTFAAKLPSAKQGHGALIAFVVIALGMVRAFCASGATSAHYNNVTELIGAAGSLSTSADYTSVDSVGGAVGTSGSTIHYTNKHGFIGQLYDVVGLEVVATPSTVAEGASRQVMGRPVLDDGTTFALLAGDVNWSLVGGPLTSVSPGGLVSAGVVHADTGAMVQGSWLGFSDTLALQVLNTDPDNFGSYAGDGLEDGWQVQFFGLNNPAAAPLLDPDGDGQNNRFEFLAGVTPTDPSSIFRWRVESAPDLSGNKRLSFSPVLPDRVYTIRYTDSLGSLPLQWSTLSPGPAEVIDTSGERTVIDATSASESRRFYRLELTKP
jgi:hypothetical protein